MKVLIFTHHQLNINGGGAFASKAIANAFSRIAEKVTLLYPSTGENNQVIGLDAAIDAVPVKYDKSKILKFLDFLVGKVNRYGDIAGSFFCSGHYDTVVFDNSKTSFRLLEAARLAGLRVITIHHNFEYEFAKGNSKGIIRPIDLFWSKRYESAACVGSDLNITLTKQDAESLSSAFTNGDKHRFAVLGIFESSENELPEVKENDGRNTTFAITGNLGITQTVDSLLPWLKNYFPVIRNTFPEFKLIIAGRNPDKRIQRLCKKDGIELVASPASMDAIMHQSDCYVCPANLGSGIKLRVMDGLKWGLPVIAHKVSSRGYDKFADMGVLFSYDDLDSFSTALESVRRVTVSRRDIQTQYSKEFSFLNGVGRLRDILTRFGLC